jgi:transposase
MRSDLITMTPRELVRLEAMHALKTKTATQKQVARRLGLTVRQVKRLWRAFRTDGEQGLLSKRRGRPSNRRRPTEDIQRAIALVREHYADFGPTLASEKLLERHELRVDRETLRKAMAADGLWNIKRRRRRYHPPRERRPRYGELVQIDGSPHAWFEDRVPRCTLLVFIDDATSGIVAMRFARAETTNAYFGLAKEYFERSGLPEAFYSDRFSVFRQNQDRPTQGDLTQFARAMEELNIELICANSPQAKGRVERAIRPYRTVWSKNCGSLASAICKPAMPSSSSTVCSTISGSPSPPRALMTRIRVYAAIKTSHGSSHPVRPERSASNSSCNTAA